jgi:hypothetical protein
LIKIANEPGGIGSGLLNEFAIQCERKNNHNNFNISPELRTHCLQIKELVPILNVNDANAFVKENWPPFKLDDATLLPRQSREDKLRSYWTLVYGEPDVWHRQDLTKLEYLWKVKEIVYFSYCRALNLEPFINLENADTRVPRFIPSFSDGNPNNVWLDDCAIYPVTNRGVELTSWVEVFRVNETSFESISNKHPAPFASTFFVPCLGSGYWMPTGKIICSNFKSDHQNNVFPIAKATLKLENQSLTQSIIVSGADTVMFFSFSDHSEYVSRLDHVNTQSFLKQMTPFDARANQPSTKYEFISPIGDMVGTTPPFSSDATIRNCFRFTKWWREGPSCVEQE